LLSIIVLLFIERKINLKKLNITNIIMIILALFLAIVLGITIYMSIPKKIMTLIRQNDIPEKK